MCVHSNVFYAERTSLVLLAVVFLVSGTVPGISQLLNKYLLLGSHDREQTASNNGKSIKLVFRRFEPASFQHCYKYLKFPELFCFLNKCLFILSLVCMSPYTAACWYCMVRLENNLQELVFSFYPVSHGIQLRSSGLVLGAFTF